MSVMFVANTSRFDYLTRLDFHIFFIKITSLCVAPQTEIAQTERTLKYVTVHVYSVQNSAVIY
jgi:hypothetical protein